MQFGIHLGPRTTHTNRAKKVKNVVHGDCFREEEEKEAKGGLRVQSQAKTIFGLLNFIWVQVEKHGVGSNLIKFFLTLGFNFR